MRERSPETLEVLRHKNRDRRAEAEDRKSMRSKLSAQQQLLVLDKRLGTGIGAVKERMRLNRIVKENN